MKKLIITSSIYGGLALAGGVFFREFTKFNGFEGITKLSILHTHLFILGALLFLLLALFLKGKEEILNTKIFKAFFITHNIALPLFSVMLLTRGICEVLNIDFSTNSFNGMIAGLAGLTHILLLVSLVLFMVLVFKSFKKTEENTK